MGDARSLNFMVARSNANVVTVSALRRGGGSDVTYGCHNG